MRPDDVLPTLREHLLVDGLDLVLDLDKSEGSWLVDARDGRRILDLFSFFASNALGMNHPRLHDPEVEEELLRSARHKPSNSDVYSEIQARFVATFQDVLGDPALPHLFLIEGGALAIENALKTAFDWKSRRNEAAGRSPELGTQVLHLTGAFHGRTGYTMSLTNTDPVKTARFPKFGWPRIETPALTFPLGEHADANLAAEETALAQARAAFSANPHDIACFVAEPIQGEGGDRHLSGRFLRAMQELCHEHDALFVLDEIQTGVGLTGTAWCYEQHDLEPDIVAFGKKTHVCGIMAGRRVDDVEDNVFAVSSRLNSTFGGGLTDMARARVILEVIRDESLIDAARRRGQVLRTELMELSAVHPGVTNVRGRGLMCAFDLPDAETRTELRARLLDEEHVAILGSGPRSVRFRPPLTIDDDELRAGVAAMDRVLGRMRDSGAA